MIDDEDNENEDTQPSAQADFAGIAPEKEPHPSHRSFRQELPDVGQVVHYTPTSSLDEDYEQGDPLAAIVTAVLKGGRMNLYVYAHGEAGPHAVLNAEQGDGEGMWHWPQH
jgi:hypothetical protein